MKKYSRKNIRIVQIQNVQLWKNILQLWKNIPEKISELFKFKMCNYEKIFYNYEKKYKKNIFTIMKKNIKKVFLQLWKKI